VGIVLLIVAGRVGYLTVIKGDASAERAEKNLQFLERLNAPRGDIFDSKGRAIAYNEDRYDIYLIRRGLDEVELEQSLFGVGELLGENLIDQKDDILSERDKWKKHLLGRNEKLADVIAIKEKPEDFPGVRLERDTNRIYPYNYALAHILGYTGKIQPHQVEEYEWPIYLQSSSVGQAGLEKVFEDQLVGKRGVLEKKVNARRTLLEEPQIIEEAHSGTDITLTIDAELQQYACDLIGERSGSVVFMDVRDGLLLVMASMPSFDPHRPGATEVDGLPVSWVNRAISGVYPPGSTFKLVTAAAALESGYSPDHSVTCHGHYQWGSWNHRFHCDARSGHGPIQMIDSLKKSCNVYYYETGVELGGERIAQEALRFGFGKTTGIELSGEKSGQFANKKDYPTAAEVVNFSIGQGELLATPLQVTKSFAILANGGYDITPHLVQTSVTSTHERVVNLTAKEREALIEGFWRVANEYGGTAYRADFDQSWEVVSKTGTAEVSGDNVDAWFAGFYPRSNPKYAFVAHIENADGHGGDIAAPIIREMIRAIEADDVDSELSSDEQYYSEAYY